MSIGPSIPEIQHIQNSTLKIQGQGQMTMMLHNYRSRQFYRTWNGINLSSGFRVFGPWASPYGANGHMTVIVHTYRPRQFHRTSNGENPLSGYRDTGSASLAAARPPARPPARTMMTIPLQPGGLRGKKDTQTKPKNCCAYRVCIKFPAQQQGIQKKNPQEDSRGHYTKYLSFISENRTQTMHTAFLFRSHYCIVIRYDGNEIWLEEMDWYATSPRVGSLSQFFHYFPSFPKSSKSCSYVSGVFTFKFCR